MQQISLLLFTERSIVMSYNVIVQDLELQPNMPCLAKEGCKTPWVAAYRGGGFCYTGKCSLI